MAAAGKYTNRIEPSSKSILYIDDRTIIAPSREALLRTCHAWEQSYEVTRLKNNDGKQQFFARTISAYVNMQEHGIDAKPHAEVLGVSIGIKPRKRTPKVLTELVSYMYPIYVHHMYIFDVLSFPFGSRHRPY